MVNAIPSSFWQAVDQFNQGQFYDCHDTLEALWLEAMECDRRFYQGILQIAVACYHLTHQNWRGAMILLGEGSHRLLSYPSAYFGIQVERLVADSMTLLSHLQQVMADVQESEAIAAQAWTFPQIERTSPAPPQNSANAL
jgi:hypothetical protein